MGGIFVSADIIPFIPRPNHRNGPASFLRTSRSALRPDDLAMDHVDMAPYEERCEEDPETRAGLEA
jgi:hypothetical protein